MRLSNLNTVLRSLSLCALGASLSVACGGSVSSNPDGNDSTAGDGDGDSSGDGDGDDVKPGEQCPLMGQTGTSDCNTCTCEAGMWSCTERACPEPECTEGETQKVDCNTCECDAGRWSCSQIDCNLEEVCQDGELHSEGSQQCVCKDNAWDCAADLGTSCKEEDFPAGVCNACSCIDGQLVCTDLYCPPPACEEGDTKDAGDNCNTCSCAAGQWFCTQRPCAAPIYCGARAGDTCSDTEFCAYEEGDLCGAADAEAICKPRPEICDLSYAPVCGCDGITYGNACAAASAGTGVGKSGECTPSK